MTNPPQEYEQDPELFMVIKHLKEEGYRIVKLSDEFSPEGCNVYRVEEEL